MSKAIVWFRDNLRVADNEPLLRAVEENDAILPVYIFEVQYWHRDDWGFIRTGKARTQFLIESVLALKKQLQQLGANLLIRKGNAQEILFDLANEHKINHVYAPAAFSYDEQQAEAQLSKQIDLKLFWTSSLIHPDDLPFDINDLPDIFTQFRKKAENYSEVRSASNTPDRVIAIAADYDQAEWIETEPSEKDQRSAIHFVGGEKEALDRLHHYFWKTENITRYKETRNGLLGADYSSKFSPWLANGAISPKTIYWQLKKFEDEITSNSSTYWLFFELLWRDFFRYVSLKFGRQIFLKQGLKYESIKCYFNSKKFEQWRTGNTGKPFVDANMRELLHTGFMSNRGRQNVASYLVHDMSLDWRAGAAWFESQLIDYDPCSNYGNWLYVAGLGNDPRPNRKFNIERQASMYDPDGKYVYTWLD